MTIYPKPNGYQMDITATPAWPIDADVLLTQSWYSGKILKRTVSIELTVTEAETLIADIQSAIARVRQDQSEYDAYVTAESNSQRQGTSETVSPIKGI